MVSIAFFTVIAIVAIVAALMVILMRNAVHSALFLVVTLFCIATLFLTLGAEFLAAVQVLVYAGAIMVVFLFVVMLLNLGQPSELADARGKWGKFGAGIFGLILIAEVWVLSSTKLNAPLVLPRGANEETLARLGAVGSVAKPLFNEFLLPFELTSVLLLIAIVGAVLLGRRSDAG